jgi:hypothetical protein
MLSAARLGPKGVGEGPQELSPVTVTLGDGGHDYSENGRLLPSRDAWGKQVVIPRQSLPTLLTPVRAQQTTVGRARNEICRETCNAEPLSRKRAVARY